MSGEGGGDNPWAWLGLLKWSLAYSDGTNDGETPPMSEEDKAFLEGVMKDGIVDENERMKKILREVTGMMTKWREAEWKEDEADQANELLQELRDTVEQIDFARAFAAMKGLEFLLGCVQERTRIPKSTRSLCLGILATLSSNNPPVQKQLLELGALKDLSELYFVEQKANHDDDGKLRARTVQAISATVRSHQMAETIFCQLPQSQDLLLAGLGVGKEYTATPQVLRQRTIFLLRALVTSDFATAESLNPFQEAIGWTADFPVDDKVESSPEIREMTLAMLQQILEQGKLAVAVRSRNDALVALGIRRVAALRALTGEEREFASVELDHWESILVLLARTENVAKASSSNTLLLKSA